LIAEAQIQKYPLTKNVFEYINKNYSLFSKACGYILGSFDDKYLSLCEDILSILQRKCQTETNFLNSQKAFIRYSHEYLLLQSKLLRDGRYLYSSFEEVNQNLYQNKKMQEYYLDGLLLSQILWPNHYKIGQYFISWHNLTDLSSVVLDVPSGTGIYSYFMARYFKFRELSSLDISPYAKLYTEGFLRSCLLDTGKITVKRDDIYNLKEKQGFDFIVCGELLEHVEDPDELLKKLSCLLKNRGKLFLTTAVYAAAIDHLCLFNNVNEARKLITKYFRLNSELILPISLEKYQPQMDKVPLNYACILSRN